MSHHGLEAVLTGRSSAAIETLDVIPHYPSETDQVNFTIFRTPASVLSTKSSLSIPGGVDSSASKLSVDIEDEPTRTARYQFRPYSANDSNIIELKNRRDIKKINTPLSKYGIYSIQFSPDGEQIAVGYGNGAVCMVKNSEHDPVVSPVFHGQKKLPTLAIKFHFLQKLVFTAGAAGEVNVWDFLDLQTSSEPKTSLIEDGNEINALDICSDGLYFATAGKDRHIRLYDCNTLRLYHTIAAPDALAMDESSIFGGHTQKIFALKFHPDENHLFVTAGWDNCMKIWDKRMARAARKSVAGPRVCGDAIDMRGNYIITGSFVAKDSVQLWDIRGNFFRNINFPHNKQKGDFIYCAKFIDKETIIAGGSGINTTCAINLKGDVLVDVIEYGNKAILAADSWNNGSVLVNGGIGGILQIAYLQ